MTEARPISIAAFRESIERHARYSLGQPWESLSPRQLFECVSLAVRDLSVDRQLETEQRFRQADAKHLYYLSIEYLPGRMLTNNLSNLGIYDLCRDTLRQMGVSLEDVEETERDAALGNGGLGRLAACFLDSLATLDMPGYGYGINYEYGLFRQEIDDGYQREKPDNWLAVRHALGNRTARRSLPRSRLRPDRTRRRSIGSLQPDVAGLAAAGRRSARRVRRRLRRADGESPPALLRQVLTRFRHADLQHRRLSEGGGTEDCLGDHLEGAVSVRRRTAGAGTAPAPGVLPGRLRDAGPGRPLPARSRRPSMPFRRKSPFT